MVAVRHAADEPADPAARGTAALAVPAERRPSFMHAFRRFKVKVYWLVPVAAVVGMVWVLAGGPAA